MSASGFRWDRPFTRDDLEAVYDDYIHRNQMTVSFSTWMNRNIPKEGYYQGKILEWLKAEQRSGRIPRMFFSKTASGPYMRRGLPDTQCCIDGEYWGFEVKRPIVGAASDLQLQTAKEIRAQEAIAAHRRPGKEVTITESMRRHYPFRYIVP